MRTGWHLFVSGVIKGMKKCVEIKIFLSSLRGGKIFHVSWRVNGLGK